MFEQFTEFIKELSKNHIFLDKNFILEMLSSFDISIEKLSYPSSNLDCLSIALDFYKNFNLDYYNIIEEGIKNKTIVMSDSLSKSCVTHNEIKAYIQLTKTDMDLINIVHEFGHYIDRVSTPRIVSDEYWFLGETLAFYMERELEKFLGNEYENIFKIRKNNRLYMEKNMLQIVELALYYRDMYLTNGKLDLTEADIENIKRIMRVGEQNLINFLLSYPLANFLSYYLSYQCSNVTTENFCELCLECDLKRCLEECSSSIGLKDSKKLQ